MVLTMTIKEIMKSHKILIFSLLSLAMIIGSIIAAEMSGHSKPANALSTSLRTSSRLTTFGTCDFGEICSDPSWRSPLELSLRDPKFPTDQSRKIRWDVVQSRIRAVVAQNPNIHMGLYIKDIASGQIFEVNPQTKFASASLVKVPLAIGLYKDMAEGKISPVFGPLYLSKHVSSGSGILKNEATGKKVNLRDLSYLMLSKSDNTATNIITDLVGQDRVTELCKRNGWTHTNMVRPVMSLELRRFGIENWTTAKEMGQMFEGMYLGKLVSPEASREMIRMMLNTYVDDRLQRYLPRGIDISHKTGLINDNAHDVGIIYLPGNQAVVVSALVDGIGSDYMSAKRPIAQIARILYEEATIPSAHRPGRRN